MFQYRSYLSCSSFEPNKIFFRSVTNYKNYCDCVRMQKTQKYKNYIQVIYHPVKVCINILRTKRFYDKLNEENLRHYSQLTEWFSVHIFGEKFKWEMITFWRNDEHVTVLLDCKAEGTYYLNEIVEKNTKA